MMTMEQIKEYNRRQTRLRIKAAALTIGAVAFKGATYWWIFIR